MTPRKKSNREEVSFVLSETDLVEMKPLYPLLLDTLKELLNPKHRRLFLQDNSKLLKYMGDIEEGEDAKLKLGDYPAIEAMAFAVIEMLRLVESGGYIPSHTGDWEPEKRVKSIEDLAYINAVDDLDPDYEDNDYHFYHIAGNKIKDCENMQWTDYATKVLLLDGYRGLLNKNGSYLRKRLIKNDILKDTKSEEWLRTKVLSIQCGDGFNFEEMWNK